MRGTKRKAEVIRGRPGGPKTHKFCSEGLRVESYNGVTVWPETAAQSPQDLAKAGFIYQGEGDSVQCFYCDGALKNWDPTDVPWVEHAKFGNCAFLQLKLGKDFIELMEKSDIENRIRERLVENRAASTVASQEVASKQLTLEQLQDENRKLTERKRCKHCHGAVILIAFKPCFHMSACDKCAPTLSRCPVCDKEIQERKTIFF